MTTERESRDVRATVASGSSPTEGTGLLPLRELIQACRDHRIWFATVPALVAIVVAVWSVVTPTRYAADAYFTSERAIGAEAPSGASALALWAVGAEAANTQALDFYAALLQMRQVLETIGTSEYRAELDGEPFEGDLITLFELDDRPRDAQLRAVVKRLRGIVTPIVDRTTGMIHLQVTAPTGGLAEQIARRLLDVLQAFNVDQRQTQAASKSEFVRERLAEAGDGLRTAEDTLEAFLAQNRGFENSPSLLFQHERLVRRVELRQRVYTGLAEQFEQARIERVRDTPVITIVERPEGSAHALKHPLLLLLLLGGFVGFAGTATWVLGKTLWANLRRSL